MPKMKTNFLTTERFRCLLALNCALFVYFFLVFFQPFGVNNYKPDSVFSPKLMLGILPVIPVFFVTIYLSERFLRPAFNKISNLGSPGWFVLEFLVIGSVSFLLYNVLGNFHDFNFQSYLFHVLEVSSVIIFPFGATLFYFRFKKLETEYREVLSVSDARSSMDELLHLKGDYKKDEIALKPKEIVYLVSEDNYVGLNYLDGKELKNYLIRSTLSKMEKTLDPQYFIRCNRSHLVNVVHVLSFKKKQGRIWIQLRGSDLEIPVSPSQEKKVLASLDMA